MSSSAADGPGSFDSPTRALSDSAEPGGEVAILVEVLAGPCTGVKWTGGAVQCAVGSHPSNHLVLNDPTVSRFHCEMTSEETGVRIKDLGSKNGTYVDGVRITDAFVRSGSTVTLGESSLRVLFDPDMAAVSLSKASSFGGLAGSSVQMRHAFALLEAAVPSDVTVLLEGETGTGKEEAALAIHSLGPRANGPFIIVDCGAIPESLMEAELFGHEKGAFTGAAERRAGAFEEANGGTIFLDEIGDLPIELQPKLLRVLERRQVKRLGSNKHSPVDVRVIAATNLDLRAAVNNETFRADLYYRTAVLRIPLPSLRERPTDLAIIATRLLNGMGCTPETRPDLHTPAFLASLQRSSWPGNVRELRNHLERCRVLGLSTNPESPVRAEPELRTGEREANVDLPYALAREQWISEFEARYVEKILERHGGSIPRAAKDAGISRVHLWRLVKRAGLSGAE